VVRGRGLREWALVPVDRRQQLRVLDGRFVIERLADEGSPANAGDLLVLVDGPDGRTRIRRDDNATDGGWAALWSGDQRYDPNATGMLNAIIAPLAAADLPVMVASTYHADLVLVPTDRLGQAVATLREAELDRSDCSPGGTRRPTREVIRRAAGAITTPSASSRG
jgi:hypothetical protein